MFSSIFGFFSMKMVLRHAALLLIAILICILVNLHFSDSNNGKAMISSKSFLNLSSYIKNALKNYTGANEQPLTTEKKQYPRQVILWTSWRSGSSFTGKFFLQAFDDTFYSYEPLHVRGVKIQQEEKELERDVQFMRNLLQCKMDKIPEYVRYVCNSSFFMNMNPYLKHYMKNMARDMETMKQACQNASLHFSKLIRLPVACARKLLEDPLEDIQVVHMIRDPRAVHNSRRKLKWCVQSESCFDFDTVCSILWEDVQQIKQLQQDFPDKYMFIRYEDISLQTEEKVREMYDFLSLPFTERAQDHIKKSTRSRSAKSYTYHHTFSWRNEIPFADMQKVQSACSKSLESLGYRSFDSEKDLRDMKLPVLVDNIFDLPTQEV